MHVFYYHIVYNFVDPPCKPCNLSLLKISPRSVVLTWNNSGDQEAVSHYEVQMSVNKTVLIHVSRNTSALIDEQLLSYDGKYRFQVVAVSVAGNLVERSPPSDPVYFSG